MAVMTMTVGAMMLANLHALLSLRLRSLNPTQHQERGSEVLELHRMFPLLTSPPCMPFMAKSIFIILLLFFNTDHIAPAYAPTDNAH